jgi:hypothetical protein
MELSSLVQMAREIQGTQTWDSATILRVATALAVKVNRLDNMTGTDKQKLVCKILSQLLQEVEEKEKAEDGRSEEDKKAITQRFDKLQKIVEEVLPVSLELVVSAARGKMDLRKVSPSVWKQMCSCFATSAVAVLASQNVISEAEAKKVESVVSTTQIAVDTTEFVVENRMVAAAAPVVVPEVPVAAVAVESVVQESQPEEKKE